ncbi:MAG: ATP-binding cassette domain-containing protein, partial [Planctomycetes bacterium]|nr:ATP-binding cassette domain-containing protein [Planctomycetota bacterium]
MTAPQFASARGPAWSSGCNRGGAAFAGCALAPWIAREEPPTLARCMIQVEHVTKRYGATLAVDDVSLRVERGEVVGFLGPNGAGKSTLLRLLSTWLVPDSGTIVIAGHDTRREPLSVRRSLGYLPEHNALYETMRVDRFLAFVGRMHGLEGARLAERTGWVVEACQLGAVLAKKIQHCSKGFRQRVGVAAALIHDPPVVLLDEPTHGLDPLQVALFLEFVRGLAKTHAVLFSTH